MKHPSIKAKKSGQPETLVAILSNPCSTRNMAVMEKIRRTVENAKNAFHYELDDISSIPEALRLFDKTDPCMIIINGGDGTIQATLTSIFNDKPFTRIPPIAIIPGGKTNMIASDLGFKGSPVQILKRLLKIAEERGVAARQVERKIIELDLGDGKPPRFGMFFGGAAVVNAILYCRKHIYPMKLPNIISHGLAIPLVILRVLLKGNDPESDFYVSEQSITVRAGGILHGRYFWIFVTTLDRLILGARPYGREGKGGLKFSTVDLRPAAVWSAIRGLLTGHFGRATLNGVHTRTSDEIRIEGREPVTLDGEIYRPVPGKPVTLRGEKSLTFISLR